MNDEPELSRRTLLRLAGLAAALGACKDRPATDPSDGGNIEPLDAGGSSRLPIPRARITRPDSRDASACAPDWAKLRSKLAGTLVLPDDESYERVRVGWDQQFDRQRPAAIAQCASPSDVQACLDVVRACRVPIAARSGGHSLAGYSTPDRGLVIDVRAMQSVVVQPDGKAIIGPGARLIEVYAALAAAGRCLPSGTCPSVGIAGLTLGGGIGVLDRVYGLTCDHLVSANVILADATMRTASARDDEDLFWALRGGGGGNFGIVTSLTFETVPAPAAITVFGLTFPAGSVADVLGAWQEWQPKMPNELWSNCVVYGAAPPGAFIGGAFVGAEAALSPHLEKLIKSVGKSPIERTVLSKTYLEAMLYFANCTSKTVPQCHPLGEGEGQLERGSIAAASRMMSSPIRNTKAIDDLLREHVGVYLLFDGMRGAIADRKPQDTAFVHRDVLASVEANRAAAPADPAPAHREISEVDKALRSLVGTGSYVNYIDPAMSDWGIACYGKNLPRLKQLVARYDPDRVFDFAQNVARG